MRVCKLYDDIVYVIITEQVIICIGFTVKGRVNIQTSLQGRDLN